MTWLQPFICMHAILLFFLKPRGCSSGCHRRYQCQWRLPMPIADANCQRQKFGVVWCRVIVIMVRVLRLCKYLKPRLTSSPLRSQRGSAYTALQIGLFNGMITQQIIFGDSLRPTRLCPTCCTHAQSIIMCDAARCVITPLSLLHILVLGS